MVKRMKDGHFIDGEIQKAIQSGRQKWRDIMKFILQVILFLCKEVIWHLGVKTIKLELQMLMSSLILWK
jgi:hypothetical protein